MLNRRTLSIPNLANQDLPTERSPPLRRTELDRIKLPPELFFPRTGLISGSRKHSFTQARSYGDIGDLTIKEDIPPAKTNDFTKPSARGELDCDDPSDVVIFLLAGIRDQLKLIRGEGNPLLSVQALPLNRHFLEWVFASFDGELSTPEIEHG
jgi:hypothetical protein